MDKNIIEIINKYGGEYKVMEKAEPWKGYRTLVLVDKVKECDDIVSLYFRAKDGKKLIKHKAGQFLPFKIKTENDKYKDVVRTYSLSMKPNEFIYRISVKRVPGGLISNYLHDNLVVDDEIEATVPMGVFTLKALEKQKPMVFIAGGIGITPLLSMAYEATDLENDKYFIQAVQNSNMQPFASDIAKLEELKSLKNIVFYDKPLGTDKVGENHDFVGFITKEWIKEKLPLNAEYYFCGPPPFMKGIYRSLIDLGVKKESIYFEFFGPKENLE